MHKTQAFQPIRALRSAWDLLMKAPLPLWVGGLILVVIESFGSFGGGFDFHPRDLGEIERLLWILIPAMGLAVLLSLAVVAITSWLKVGYYTGIETVMRDGDVEFDQLFKSRGRWLNVFLAHLLQIFLTLVLVVPFFIGAFMMIGIGKGMDLGEGWIILLVVVFCLSYLPVYIYVLLGLILLPMPAALDGLGPVESLSRSWSLAAGIRMQLLLMGLLYLALTVVGLCACLIGVLGTGIITHVMWCEAYIQATRDDMGDWWVNTRGEGRRPSPSGGATRTIAAQVVEADPPQEPEESAEPWQTEDAQDAQESKAPFDPSAWRQGSDIPPIDGDTSS